MMNSLGGTPLAVAAALLLALGGGAPMQEAAAQDTSAAAARTLRYPCMPDRGDGTYVNPVIFADYSDPDVVRAGSRYYMVSSSFAHTPALPVLESRDLVNWRIIGHCVEDLPSPAFDRPGHGKGVWAPSIRFHKGEFYVYYGDPDRGIFMTKAKKAEGPWTPPLLVKEARGWIDPCPFWDDDGQAYLVHAWAKSRAGFNSVLSVSRMNAEGTRLMDGDTTVFDGHAKHPTIEGPKFYKRGSWYYIFAPAGGVKPGWQTVLRSKHVFGPYEDRVVLEQGRTPVNGPHQGAWVRTPKGEDWFIHFQDRGPYGRIVHLEPARWKDDWPVLGEEVQASGKGEPVTAAHAKPDGSSNVKRVVPQTSDEFDRARLGLQWQWEANHRNEWYSLRARAGVLRLFAVEEDTLTGSLWEAPNLLLQKFPAEAFTVTTRMDVGGLAEGERAGLIVFGRAYAALQIRREEGHGVIERVTCLDADRGGKERSETVGRLELSGHTIDLRVEVLPDALCRFSFSLDSGRGFTEAGDTFTAKEGVWVGAKTGLFSSARQKAKGHADFEFFHFE